MQRFGMRALFALLALLLPIAPDCHAARFTAGVVLTVYDGDSILLATNDGSHLKMRLYGIDAPETPKPDIPGQDFAVAAKRTLKRKIMGRRISAEVMDIDQYHRSIAIIRYNSRDVNREMVAEGMAWAYRQYLRGPYASEYTGAEDRARSMRVGLWRATKPIPPWKFRHALGIGFRHGRH